MKTRLTVKKENVKNYKVGQTVKLNRCKDDCGRIITITTDKITALADNGCYDFYFI